jgi:hypothetical protein
VKEDDDPFEQYRKRMMLGYKCVFQGVLGFHIRVFCCGGLGGRGGWGGDLCRGGLFTGFWTWRQRWLQSHTWCWQGVWWEWRVRGGGGSEG